MMIVIIPHPTEELKIIRLQKELIQKLNVNGTVFYALSPLWIELPESFHGNTKQELKSLGTQIKQVTIDNLFYNENKVFLKVIIRMDNNNLELELPILKLYKGNIDNIDLSCRITFKELKVFRIGNSILTSPVSKAISESVWKKL